MHFAISDKVVCVDDAFDEKASSVFSSLPVKNQVYVIRELAVYPDGDWGVCLVGITGKIVYNAWVGRVMEWRFAYQRFRKLDEVKAENTLARQCVEADYLNAR